MVTFPKTSESEQIRNFHEELAAVVDIAVAKPVQIAVWIKREAWIEILEIAVVAEIDCRARMEQIREENVGVEILRGLQ